MTRFYKTPSKRLIARGHKGRFRKTTMRDVGFGCCQECGTVFVPDYSKAVVNGLIDPRRMREIERTCPDWEETR